MHARIVSVLLIHPHRQSCSADAASHALARKHDTEDPGALEATATESAWEKSRERKRSDSHEGTTATARHSAYTACGDIVLDRDTDTQPRRIVLNSAWAFHGLETHAREALENRRNA